MQSTEIIIGNACSLCACVTDSVSGAQKKRSRMLGIQIISQLFYAACTIVLKGYSSTVQNGVAILRNIVAIKNVKSKALEWGLVVLGVALGVIFNNRGLLGYLPIVANLEYSVAMFQFKHSEKGLKLAFIVNMLMYAVFSFFIMNYVGTAANLIVAATTAVSLIKRKKAAEEPQTEEQTGEEA